MQFQSLAMLRVSLRAPLDPEALLDGPLVMESEEPAVLIFSTGDPDALAKLGTHPAVEGVERIGEGALITGWTTP